MKLHIPLLISVSALIAGCGDGASPDDTVAAQERLCADTVAAHIDQPVSEVSVTSTGVTVAGGALAAATDGNRAHTCEFGADGRLVALWHPGEGQ